MERQPLTLPAGLCLDPGTTLQDAETLLGWATLAVAANAALYLKAPGVHGMKPSMDYGAMVQDAAELACRMQEAAFLLVENPKTMAVQYCAECKPWLGDLPTEQDARGIIHLRGCRVTR